jgi:hypothetical protein
MCIYEAYRGVVCGMEKASKVSSLILVFLLISSVLPYNIDALRRKSGSGELSPGQSKINVMDADVGDLMSGEFKATGGILVLGILHEDYYVEGENLNSFACIYYKSGSEGTFNFQIDHNGDWYFVLSNPTSMDVEYEYEWIKKTTDDQLMEVAGWFTIPAIILLIIAYVVFIKRKRE